ncbi:hypothetical protein GCM10009850_083540 [Nonomuraea monospora]|uniref:Uncharacterized protein n=1 Tax=Nonomuraea monospora TaxID=568818 RepID=A0ABN3CUB3_9ACTN
MASLRTPVQVPVWAVKTARGPLIALAEPDPAELSDDGILVLRQVSGQAGLVDPVAVTGDLSITQDLMVGQNAAGIGIAIAMLVSVPSLDPTQATQWGLADGILTIPRRVVTDKPTSTGGCALAQSTLSFPADAAPAPAATTLQVPVQLLLGQDAAGHVVAVAVPLRPFATELVSRWLPAHTAVTVGA